ncbi:MAG: hypothetical protein QF773_04775 [Lentisphaeria bacterium]|nr:hypothetical protein [Lentisphaeria bacterium]
MSWQALDARERLPNSFIWSTQIARNADDDEALRFRLAGTTALVDTSIESGRCNVWLITGKDQGEKLVESAISLTAGTTISAAVETGLLSIFVDSQRLIVAPLPLQKWRSGSWSWHQQQQDSPALVGETTFQKTGPVFFDEDFMHTENDLGEWTVRGGRWTVVALNNPTRSANPFSLTSKAAESVITAGYPFWRNYEFSCAVQTEGVVPFGLLLCYTEAAEYRLEFEPGTSIDTLSLTRRDGEQITVLGHVNVTGIANQWTVLRVSQFHGHLNVWHDDIPLMSVVDPAPLIGGAVGVSAKHADSVRFDDASVRPVTRLDMDAAQSDPALRALVLANVSVTARVESIGDGVTLYARRNDLGDEITATLKAEAAGNLQVGVGGAAAESATVEAPPRGPFDLALHVLDGDAWCSINDRIVAFGKCGGITAPGTAGVDGNVIRYSVAAATPLPAIKNRVRVFEHEKAMAEWSKTTTDWFSATDKRDAIHWHRSDFWSAVSIEQDLRPWHAELKAHSFALLFAGETTAGKADQIELKIAQKSEDDVYVEIRSGNMTSAITFKKDALPESMQLERRGGKILAWIDGELWQHFDAPESLADLCRVGHRTSSQDESWVDTVVIGADNVASYSFRTAPVDWSAVAGDWKVTNRWQCDPRWSFYSGYKRNGVACNWHKAEHGDSVTLDFYVGPKMQKERGGKYEYVADFNAVLAADGRDVNSGYSFMLGGCDNAGSIILRSDNELNFNEAVKLPRGGDTHRRWFHVKIRKHGNRLRFWVDNKLAGDVTDDNPLQSRRFGLWTWDNGMMIAQFRISTNVALETAPAINQPPIPKTPYDTIYTRTDAGFRTGDRM